MAANMINEAINVFEERCKRVTKSADNTGLLARALAMRASFLHHKIFERKQDLERARKLCLEAYGAKHKLFIDLVGLTGDLQEDLRNYKQAHETYKEEHDLCMQVLGPNHPDTKAAKTQLNRKVYKDIRSKACCII